MSVFFLSTPFLFFIAWNDFKVFRCCENVSKLRCVWVTWGKVLSFYKSSQRYMLHQKEGIFKLYMWCNCNNETFSLHWFFYKVIMKKVLSVWYDCTILFICFNSNVLLQGKQIDTNSLYFSTLSGSSRMHLVSLHPYVLSTDESNAVPNTDMVPG